MLVLRISFYVTFLFSMLMFCVYSAIEQHILNARDREEEQNNQEQQKKVAEFLKSKQTRFQEEHLQNEEKECPICLDEFVVGSSSVVCLNCQGPVSRGQSPGIRNKISPKECESPGGDI